MTLGLICISALGFCCSSAVVSELTVLVVSGLDSTSALAVGATSVILSDLSRTSDLGVDTVSILSDFTSCFALLTLSVVCSVVWTTCDPLVELDFKFFN